VTSRPMYDDPFNINGDDAMTGFEPGTVIDGRYELVEPIGMGATAVVFKARQLALNREVAIKLLDLRNAPGMEARFVQEAQAISAIEHPNIVRIHDFSFAPTPYIVMDLLAGSDLDTFLSANGPMTTERALKHAKGVLSALETAHTRGVIHRDIKPANLFLKNLGTEDEVMVLLDFGIAHVKTNSRLTTSGQLFGTPQYLAPEWITQQLVSPAMDVYQVGLVLIEMLSGLPAVNEVNAYDCLMAHSNGELDIPTKLLSSPIGPVLKRATALSLEVRYASAREFIEAIEQVERDTIRYGESFETSGERHTVESYHATVEILNRLRQTGAPQASKPMLISRQGNVPTRADLGNIERRHSWLDATDINVVIIGVLVLFGVMGLALLILDAVRVRQQTVIVEAPVVEKPTGAAQEVGGTDVMPLSEEELDVATLLRGARAAHREEHVEEAIALYVRAIQADPGHVLAREELGWVYLKLSRFKEAVAVFVDAVNSKLLSENLLVGLAVAHLGLGDTQEARAAFEQYLELFPTGRKTADVQEQLLRLDEDTASPTVVTPTKASESRDSSPLMRRIEIYE